VNVGIQKSRNSDGRHWNIEKADLEKRTIEALQRYRDAFARATELERQEIAARREVSKRLKAPIPRVSPARSQLIQAGQAAIFRLNHIRLALNDGAATLDSAYETLAVLLDELGYVPVQATDDQQRRDAGSECAIDETVRL